MAKKKRILRVTLITLASVVLALAVWTRFDPYGPARAAVSALAPDWKAPKVSSAEASKSRALKLRKVAEGFTQITDIQFAPGKSDVAVVLQKTGQALWLRLADGTHGPLFDVEVSSVGEEGLLGLAFHPKFASNGLFYLDYVRADGRKHFTHIAQWKMSSPSDLTISNAREDKTLLRVEQPFQNHKAGQLQFGPDGFLYIGFGDGGLRDDPFDNGQKPDSLLGKMLRVDVDHPSGDKPYGIPKDNPFLKNPKFAPEIFAYGLRNPWRYSFDPKGRLIVADVGQDAWEEISIVQAGDNLGWKIKEGFACTKDGKQCPPGSFVDPVHVYGRNLGASITGGYVYTGKRNPALVGRYVFGDFVSGRIFALRLPDDRKQRVKADVLFAASMLPVTFGRDAAGELYVADFAAGKIFTIDTNGK